MHRRDLFFTARNSIWRNFFDRPADAGLANLKKVAIITFGGKIGQVASGACLAV
jgi:hypothetical protein